MNAGVNNPYVQNVFNSFNDNQSTTPNNQPLQINIRQFNEHQLQHYSCSFSSPRSYHPLSPSNNNHHRINHFKRSRCRYYQFHQHSSAPPHNIDHIRRIHFRNPQCNQQSSSSQNIYYIWRNQFRNHQSSQQPPTS